MAVNYIQPGERINFIAERDYRSGEVVMVGGVTAVAVADVDQGEQGVAATAGVWALPKAAEPFNAGQAVFWEQDGKQCTGKPSGRFIGWAWAPAADTAAELHVKLAAAPEPLSTGDDLLTITAGAEVSKGQLVFVEDLAAVALEDIPAGGQGRVTTEGVHLITGKTAAAIAQGKKLYWDSDANPVGGPAGSGALTVTASGNRYVGVAWAAAGAGDSAVLVKLNV